MAKSRKKTANFVPATATLPQSVRDRTAASSDRDRIAARAYELYMARGGTDGMDMEDWLLAEREVRGQVTAHGDES